MKRKIIAGLYLLAIILCCVLFCRYIFLYNAGNKHYRAGDYTSAIEDYEKALKANPPGKQECDIRINLALSMIYNLGSDYNLPDQVDRSIQTLKQARDVLTEKGCATDMGDGHNATSEKLKTEIDELIKELENQSPNADGDTKEEEEASTPEEDEAEQNLKEQLQQQQKDAYKQRQDGLDFAEELQTDYNFDMETPIW